MFYTKKWGIVSSKAELHMLVNAEHKFEEKRENERHGRDDLHLRRRRDR